MLKAIAIIATIVVVIITTLAIIGLVVGQAEDGPTLEGFGPEDVEAPVPGGPNFEISTFNHFLVAAMSGCMPGGETTDLPLFPKENMVQFSTKYVDWAPEPFNKLPPPAMEALGPVQLGPMPGESPAPIIRVAYVMSGFDRMLVNKGMKNVGPSFKSMRSRLWFGMPPISAARWKSKALDDEQNIEEAMAIIKQVIDVFQYQLKPEVQGDIRTTFNKVWAEIDVFHDAIVALHTQRGEPTPEFNIAKLWQEYIKLHFQYTEKQARAWVFKHLQILFQTWKDRFLQVMMSGREINETQKTIKIDHYALMILNKLLAIYTDADIFIRTRTDGFAMAEGIDRRLAGAISLDKTPEQLNKIYGGLEKKRVADLKKMIEVTVAAHTKTRRASPEKFPPFLEECSAMRDRELALIFLMKEIENPLPLGEESWVRHLVDEKVERFGFVVYRNTYSETDEEWAAFRSKLEEGLESGWDGVLGAESVKGNATLYWIDGRNENIPEGDVDGVREHFKTFVDSSNFPAGLTKCTCLAITPPSIESFTTIPEAEQKGDFRGFVVAIDPEYDASKAAEDKHNHDYKGKFNIIDQLVWTDLYALKVNRVAQTAQEYWHLATQHPWDVYVGPTTGVRRRLWREMKDSEGGCSCPACATHLNSD